MIGTQLHRPEPQHGPLRIEASASSLTSITDGYDSSGAVSVVALPFLWSLASVCRPRNV